MKEEKPNYVRGTKENSPEWDLKDEPEKMTEMEAFVHFRQRPNRYTISAGDCWVNELQRRIKPVWGVAGGEEWKGTN